MKSGTIYAIIDDNYFYIGSTTKTLEVTLQTHINASKNVSYKYSKLYNYINNIRKGWDDIIYIPLETVECNTLRELENIEYSYIKPHIGDEYCLNILKDVSQKHIIKYFKQKYKK
jgi:hypothetical protein